MARVTDNSITLAASAARTTTGSGSEVRLDKGVRSFQFVLDVTVDESTAADKLDVYIQTKVDDTNWVDVVHFTQHDGNTGAARYFAKICADVATSAFANSAALAEANVRNFFGPAWRVRWAVTDDSGNASFTFSVTLCPY